MDISNEHKLAYEIATALDDLKSIDWHIAVCKRNSPALLKGILADTLSRTYLDNPAAYYNKAISRHEKRSGR